MNEFTCQGRDGCRLYITTVGEGPVLVLLHGGGPDHSLLPLAERLADKYTVVLPDIRGYGRSVCTDPACHTWNQYSDDVISLLDHLDVAHGILIGTGLGGTIALRTGLTHPGRVRAAVVISLEDIEDDQEKDAEIAFMDAFATRVKTDGIEAAWEPILGTLAPVIGTLVRDAIPRSDPASVAAAAAIGHDRAFRRVADLAAITTPTLLIPGSDERTRPALPKPSPMTFPTATSRP